jgi:hypothetical protein
LLNADRLDEGLVSDTLNAILKYEGDIRKAQEDLKDYLAKQKAKAASVEASTPKAEGEKDLLH